MPIFTGHRRSSYIKLSVIRMYNQTREMDQMTDANIIDEKARYIYESHREEWEKLYRGKIIAIDIEENDLASAGERIGDVDIDARKKRPGHRFFMRRVGKNPATVRLG
jgi:hypothetical protein